MPKSRQSNKKKVNKNRKYRHLKNNYKSIVQVSELDVILKGGENSHSLDYVLRFFQTTKLFSLFSGIKSKGVGLSRIFFTLIILKFLRIETVNGIYTTEFKEVEAGKDVFYDFKNNENIPWRKILLETAKIHKRVVSRKKTVTDNDGFIKKVIKTLHLDDSDIFKRGLKMEGVGSIWSHAENRSVIGYKILVLGFWDGECFLPIDFSLHREKGKRLANAISQVDKKEKDYDRVKVTTQEYQKGVADYQKATTTAEKQLATAKKAKLQRKSKKARMKIEQEIKDLCQLLKMTNKSLSQLKRFLTKSEKELKQKEIALQKAQVYCDKIEQSGIKYGLSKKERSKQFSKKRNKKSYGFKRYEELNSKKNKNAEKMIRRAVYHGFIPDYILADSWFFSHSILATVRALDKGRIHYLGMAKMGNILYSIGDEKYKKLIEVKFAYTKEGLRFRFNKVNKFISSLLK